MAGIRGRGWGKGKGRQPFAGRGDGRSSTSSIKWFKWSWRVRVGVNVSSLFTVMLILISCMQGFLGVAICNNCTWLFWDYMKYDICLCQERIKDWSLWKPDSSLRKYIYIKKSLRNFLRQWISFSGECTHLNFLFNTLNNLLILLFNQKLKACNHILQRLMTMNSMIRTNKDLWFMWL